MVPVGAPRSSGGWRGAIAALAAVPLLFAGCRSNQPVFPEAWERRQVECRSISNSGDLVFDVTLDAPFDYGYLVTLCDRRSGLVTGEYQFHPGRVNQIPGVTVFIDRTRREIRITTSIDGSPTFDKQRIEGFYAGLSRHVSLAAPAQVPEGVSR